MRTFDASARRTAIFTPLVRSTLTSRVAAILCGLVGVLLLAAAPALAGAPEAPEVVVEAPVHATSATFRGVLRPNAPEPVKPGTYEFLYKRSGTECRGESRAPATPAIFLGFVHEEVSETVTGLKAGTVYTVCLLARDGTAGEETVGPAVTFMTATPSEEPESGPAGSIGSSSAVLEGVLDPHGAASAKAGWYFAYSTGAKCTSGGVGGGETGHEGEVEGTAVPEHVEVGGLEPHQKYRFCLVATDDAGDPTTGNEVSFETLALAPAILSEGASGVKASEATLEAQIDPDNETTSDVFEYATSEAVLLAGTGTKHAGVPLSGFPEQHASVAVSGLEPGTTYFYRVVAENEQSEKEGKPVVGAPQSFTTVPVPATEPATAVTATTATFHGTLTPLNETVAAYYAFDYALLPSKCTEGTGAGGEAGTGSGALAVHAEVSELQPNAEYAVCLVSANAFGLEAGAPAHFKTLAAPPKVDGEAVSGVTGSEATLEAQVNPNNQQTTYAFEYATSPVLAGAVTLAGAAALEGFGDQAASVATGAVLRAGETYYYRVVAENAAHEKIAGAIQSFTPQGAPLASTGEAKNITRTSAVLTGTVNPAGRETTYHYLYAEQAAYEKGLGESPSNPYIYGHSTPEAPIGSGTTVLASEPVEVGDLTPGTVYHYALVATSSFEEAGEKQHATTFGADRTFTTAPPILPVFGAVSATGVGQSTATIAATLQANGEPTRWELLFGSTPGSMVYRASGRDESAEAQPLVVGLEDLAPASTYYYRLVATDPDDQAAPVATPEGSFTTAPGPPPPTLASTPPLTIPSSTPPAETKTTTPSPREAAKCPRGKRRSHGRCVKSKSKKKPNGKKGKK